MKLKRIQKIFNSKIVLCPSRRTPENLLKYFKEKKPKNIIIAAKKNNENPYPGIIYNAKLIIATTDSINLLSEAIGSGKSVFVLDLFKPKKKKYLLKTYYQKVRLNTLILLKAQIYFLMRFNL